MNLMYSAENYPGIQFLPFLSNLLCYLLSTEECLHLHYKRKYFAILSSKVLDIHVEAKNISTGFQIPCGFIVRKFIIRLILSRNDGRLERQPLLSMAWNHEGSYSHIKVTQWSIERLQDGSMFHAD